MGYLRRAWIRYRSEGILSVVREAYLVVSNEIKRIILLLLHKLGIDPVSLLRVWTSGRAYLCRKTFTDADPYKILWVDPNRITKTSRLSKPIVYGEVRDGDWDRKSLCFSKKPVYQGLEAHFERDIPLENTPYHKYFLRVTEIATTVYESPDEFDKRVNELNELYETIRDEGYKTQRELYDRKPRKARYHNNDSLHPYLNEVKVDISRSGEFLWRYGGQHRLTIAQLLDIDKIPVYVITRHAEWQALRDELRSEKQSLEDCPYSDHPDLIWQF